ncbi:site-specific integrase [Streptodolium elevatio]|uniref:Site-specific integrase n=1 Tax=Streptodolium elevatio TaxID=3157996 RepID=A0ABV3D8X0_9ACTN
MELKEFREHPSDAVKWTAPKVVKQIDRRAVVNPSGIPGSCWPQSRTWVATDGPVADAWSRCSGLCTTAARGRAEATDLKVADCDLPEEGWGPLTLHETRPAAGKQWTDSGETHDDRAHKGRAGKETRPVPIPPVLVRPLREHLEQFPNAKDGRVFGNERRGVVGASTYSRTWEEARNLALTPAQVGSPLAATPYDLRHAALSSWLNAGMDPTEVARRAGNSVEVLMRRYASALTDERS